MTASWYTGQLVRPGFVDQINDRLGLVTSNLRPVMSTLNQASDILGKAANVVDSLFVKGPQDALLGAVASIIQSLVNDLIETGTYLLFHHNLPEGVLRMGIGNLAPDLQENLPSTATEIAGNPGPNEEVQDTTVFSEQLEFSPAGPRTPIPSFGTWLSDMLAAFDDPLDSRRPQISENATIGGFLFLSGGSTVVDIIDFIRTFERILRLAELSQLYEGMFGSFDRDWLDLARLRHGGLFQVVQDSAFGASGQPPNFRSVKVSDLVSDLGTLLVSLDVLKDALNLADVATQSTSSFLRALDHRLRNLAGTLDLLDELISNLSNLLVLEGASAILALPPESGGIPNLQNRIRVAGNRPQLGPGSLIVGGGIFVTTTTGFETLAQLLFEGEENPVLLPGGGISSRFGGGSDFGDTPRAGNQTSQDTFFGGVQTQDGGSSRRPSQRSGAEEGDQSSGSMGSWVGGLLLRRPSWGTYRDEIRRTEVVSEEGTSRFVETGTKAYLEAHVAHDAPRLQAVPDLVESESFYQTGLLIEGRSFNAFADSDRFRQATLEGLTRSEHPRSAPSVDLLDYRNEAGTTVRLTSTTEWGFGNVGDATNLIGATIEDCGVRLRITSGAVGGGDVGKVLSGRQTCTVQGRQIVYPVHATIESVNGDLVTLDRPVFVPPIAALWSLSDLLLSESTSGITTWLKQQVQWYERPWCFSVFARAPIRAPWLEGLVLLFDEPSSKGPRYGVQKNLEFSFARGLHLSIDPDGSYEGGLVDLTPPTQTTPRLSEGGLVSFETTSGVNREYRIAESVTDDVSELSFRALPLADPSSLYVDWVIDSDTSIIQHDQSGTYTGFQRVEMEVPSSHVEQTDPLTGTDFNLSHAGIEELRAVVKVLSVAGPVVLDESDWSITGGGGLDGRDLLTVDSGVVSTYPGRRLEVTYPLPYSSSGEIQIAPFLLQEDPPAPLNLQIPAPPIGSFTELWRAQWETGFMTSSIPSKYEEGRAREPDTVELRSVKKRISPEGLFLQMTFYPTVRPEALTEPMTLLYFQENLGLELRPVSTSGVQVVLETSEDELSSPEFVFEKEDRLVLQLNWQEASQSIKVFRNGAGVVEVVGTSLPSLDSLLSTGATLRVGSRPDDMKPGWFTLYDLSIKENIG